MTAVELDADRTTTGTDAPSTDPLLADLRRLWARPRGGEGAGTWPNRHADRHADDDRQDDWYADAGGLRP